MNLCSLYNDIKEIDPSMASEDVYAILGMLHDKIETDRHQTSEIILQYIEKQGIDFTNDPNFYKLLDTLTLKGFAKCQ